MRFEIAASDEFVEPTVDAICEGARTGQVGDGKIFVVPPERTVRIRSGERYSAGHPSVLAFTNTLLTPACTLVVWFLIDLLRGRRVTAIGAATAIIVGCVGITPAAGFTGTCSSASSRSTCGTGCRTGCCTGIPANWPGRRSRPRPGPAYTFVGTYVILRVIERAEAVGMDVARHGEEAYTSGEGAILVVSEEVPTR